MAPSRPHGPPECLDGSPPWSPVPRQSAVARSGTTARDPGPAPSDLECGADPGPGRPSGAVTAYHPTSAPPLPAAAPAETAGTPAARQAPHAEGEARSAPPDGGEAVAWLRTPGLGTPERRAHADQARDHQADEARHAAGPDATPAAAVAFLRAASPA